LRVAGILQILTIPHDEQFEGIVFKDNCSIYLTSERKNSGDEQLYRFNICE